MIESCVSRSGLKTLAIAIPICWSICRPASCTAVKRRLATKAIESPTAVSVAAALRKNPHAKGSGT